MQLVMRCRAACGAVHLFVVDWRVCNRADVFHKWRDFRMVVAVVAVIVVVVVVVIAVVSIVAAYVAYDCNAVAAYVAHDCDAVAALSDRVTMVTTDRAIAAVSQVRQESSIGDFLRARIALDLKLRNNATFLA